MRVLLLNTLTGLYYQASDSWTAQPEMAKNFGSSFRAAVFAQDNGLETLEVYLDFDDHEYNVRLPVQGRAVES